MLRQHENRLRDRLSGPIELSRECANPECRHPFSVHHPLLGCTHEKRALGGSGFCRCDGFAVVDWYSGT